MTNDTNIAIIYQRYCNDAQTFTTTPAIFEKPESKQSCLDSVQGNYIMIKELTLELRGLI